MTTTAVAGLEVRSRLRLVVGAGAPALTLSVARQYRYVALPKMASIGASVLSSRCRLFSCQPFTRLFRLDLRGCKAKFRLLLPSHHLITNRRASFQADDFLA